MTGIIIPLISLSIAAAFQPPQVVAVIILLGTRQGTRNALAYLAGMTAFRLVLGGVAWVIFSQLEESIETRGGEFDLVVGTFILILGLLLLVYALRKGFSSKGEGEPAASWLDRLEAADPLQAFLVGVAFLVLDPRDWIIDISAVNLIAEADLSSIQSLFAYLFYILLAQLLIWLPLLLTWLAPAAANRNLARLNTWMKKNEKRIEIAVAAIFGLVFLVIGLQHLAVF